MLGEVIKDVVLPAVEIEVKKQIKEHSDELAKLIIEKLVEVCPVDSVDSIIKSFEPKLDEVLEFGLLKLADKISVKV
jgi:hypothetical protein